MAQDMNSRTTRVCEWCGESIPQQALRCPRCQKWRKDIEEDRVKCYGWTFTSILLGGLFYFYCYLGGRLGWWTVERWKSFELVGVPMDIPTTEFSIGKFLSSPLMIILIAGIIITLCLSFHYYVKVSKKIGSWFWF